jgi:hypothetical protein
LSTILQYFDEVSGKVTICCLLCGALAEEDLMDEVEVQNMLLVHKLDCLAALSRMKKEGN